MPTNRFHIARGALSACPQMLCADRMTMRRREDTLLHRAGFTLLELLIVIGIIGVLAAVLISQFGGATESARAAECLTHMRNLANSVQSYCMANNYYPTAGDEEYMDQDGKGNIVYKVHKGYIARYAQPDPYSGKKGASSHQSLKTVSTYCETPEQSRFCVTNGALWTFGARKMDEYVCPSHKRFISSQGLSGPAWSYVMNSYFGYDSTDGSETTGGPDNDIKYSSCKRPDKRLLFAELQWESSTGIEPTFDTSPGTRTDGVLQYDCDGWSGTKEAIGFNHKIGRNYVAHVCFADGHTEKLAMPGSGSSAQLIELTKWLCDSDDIEYAGGQWKRIHEAAKEDNDN